MSEAPHLHLVETNQQSVDPYFYEATHTDDPNIAGSSPIPQTHEDVEANFANHPATTPEQEIANLRNQKLAYKGVFNLQRALDAEVASEKLSEKDSQIAEKDSHIERLSELVQIDQLTGLFNRHALEPRYDKLLKSAAHLRKSDVEGTSGTSTPVGSIIMVDLDHFKKINDTHGHAEGDNTLKALGKLISHRLRDTDTAVRMGGEEFALLIEGADQDTATDIANELRLLVENDPAILTTSSMGVTQIDESLSLERNIAMADEALYFAKAGINNKPGRNQVVNQVDVNTIYAQREALKLAIANKRAGKPNPAPVKIWR